LTRGEREMIASSVSYWNDCHFCHSSHGAAAANLLSQPVDFLKEIKTGFPNTEVSQKMRALLAIAKQVQKGGKNVTAEDIKQLFLGRVNESDYYLIFFLFLYKK
jgi:alkylhydroperoxidase family enzyme